MSDAKKEIELLDGRAGFINAESCENRICMKKITEWQSIY